MHIIDQGTFFFFNDTATTEIYTLSLHDALPISPSRSGRPSESVFTFRPSFATRPVISWPKIQPSSGSRSGASPRQKCRSEPHTLASETLMRTASGSISGSGTSRISKGLPGPKKTAARPVDAMTLVLSIWPSGRLRRAPPPDGRAIDARGLYQLRLAAELERVVQGADG